MVDLVPRRTFNPKRPFADVVPADRGAIYEQDGALFTSSGVQIPPYGKELEPLTEAPAPAPSGVVKVDRRVNRPSPVKRGVKASQEAPPPAKKKGVLTVSPKEKARAIPEPSGDKVDDGAFDYTGWVQGNNKVPFAKVAEAIKAGYSEEVTDEVGAVTVLLAHSAVRAIDVKIVDLSP